MPLIKPSALTFNTLKFFLLRGKSMRYDGISRYITPTAIARLSADGDGDQLVRITYNEMPLVDLYTDTIEVYNEAAWPLRAVKLLNQVMADNDMPYRLPEYANAKTLLDLDGNMVFPVFGSGQYMPEYGMVTVNGAPFIASVNAKTKTKTNTTPITHHD